MLANVPSWISSIQTSQRTAERFALMSVYFALLLDNLLLTAVVPILPHIVHHESMQNVTFKQGGQFNESTSKLQSLLMSSVQHYHIGRGNHPHMGENTRLGFLLSLKAIVQLASNPIVAYVTRKKGLAPPLFVGSINLICCSLMFAFGRTFEVLSTARALQGVTSACFTIAGLGLVASTFKEEDKRSESLGKALGGGAVGVLLGYPIGGFLYQWTGKTVPFLAIVALGVALLALLGVTLSERRHEPLAGDAESDALETMPDDSMLDYAGKRKTALAVTVGVIFLTTSVMALLEPCLPLWLLETMKPELGAVFIPDSCGYLITTHFLGGFAYRFGRWKIATLSMIILGISCTLVPMAGSIIQLSGPHFGIGAGIGAVDAALVPLLATLADDKHDSAVSSYGKTFALGQTAVSLAYCLGPMLGGFFVESIGFPQLMLWMGILNLTLSPFVLLLRPHKRSETTETALLATFAAKRAGYHGFSNDD